MRYTRDNCKALLLRLVQDPCARRIDPGADYFFEEMLDPWDPVSILETSTH